MARGSILSRKNRDGTTTFSIKYRVSGRQVKKAIGPSRREAERALTAAMAKVDRGEIRSTSQETFKQAAERWLARKQPVIEASTYRDYETHLRLRLLPAFGRRKLRQITRGHVEDYLARLDADGRLSRKTINDSLIPLRQILGRAVRDGVIATNPAANADRDAPLELPYERPTMHYLAREQAHRYLDACEGTDRSPRC
jgi:site-specific recombinase XerD